MSCIEDIRALDAAGIPAVVFGKAIYEGQINLRDLIAEFPQNAPKAPESPKAPEPPSPLKGSVGNDE